MRLSYRTRRGIIFVLIVVFFLSLNLTLFGKEVKNFFYLISLPIQKIFWQAGGKVANFFETIREIKDLREENKELKLKIKEILAENLVLKELKKENEVLREALEIGLEKEFKLTLAKVIGKEISPDFILIDKGEKDGILEGLPVITQQKNLVGKIDKVYGNFSTVLLISSPKISFDGKIADSQIVGRVKGGGNLKIFFDLLPREEEIKKGDLVVSSALAGIFPPGLLVGEIKKVAKSDLEPFQLAQIQPAFEFKDLEKLFIITEWAIPRLESLKFDIQ